MPRSPGGRLIDALASYAASEAASRGRLYSEPAPAHRSAFQRDRDRIIHSSAFRRLEYKTQVFVNHEGDMFRTRLTHSIEVSQIARTIARALCLNEDLTEAIALAHDLGHTAFGHAGQHALNQCMREFGGFEHNLQSLRTVDQLEQKYAAFPGLNLSFETREGILKHCAREKAAGLGEVGRRFLEGTQPGLEAQVTNLADEIAYNNHDVDDGLRAGLISIEALQELGLFGRHHAEVTRQSPGLAERTVIHEVVRRMINTLVTDLIETSRARIAAAAPADIDAVRGARQPLVAFSPGIWEQHLQLKRFLRRELYRHYRVHRMTVKAGRIIRGLFAAFMDDEALLPPEARIRDETDSDDAVIRHARAVADYIAGMTDRYAIAEHERIYNPIELT